MMAVFFMSSHEDFVTAFNSFMAMHADTPNAYTTIITLAEEEGLQTHQPTDISSSIMALPLDTGYSSVSHIPFLQLAD